MSAYLEWKVGLLPQLKRMHDGFDLLFWSLTDGHNNDVLVLIWLLERHKLTA